jgi:hypothetical protein
VQGGDKTRERKIIKFENYKKRKSCHQILRKIKRGKEKNIIVQEQKKIGLKVDKSR